MKSFIICLCLLLAAGESVFAGGKKNKSGKSSKNSSTPTETQPATPADTQPVQEPTTAPAPEPTPAAPPVDPVLAATQHNIAELRADFAVLNACTNDTPPAERKTSLLNNLKAAAQGTTPPEDSIHQLADHLLTATLGRKQMQGQQLSLARYIHASFNGSHLKEAQQKMIFDAVKNIFTDSGVPAGDAGAIVGDLRKIAGETQ
jgi:hypothetical protein